VSHIYSKVTPPITSIHKPKNTTNNNPKYPQLMYKKKRKEKRRKERKVGTIIPG